jgi:hypothetical protein
LITAGTGVVEDADYGGVFAFNDAENATHGTAIAAFVDFNEDLIALHGAVYFAGGNEDVFFGSGRLAGVGADEAVTIAMEIEAACDEVFSGR